MKYHMPTQTVSIPGLHGLRNRLAPVAGAMLMLALGSFALSDPVTLAVRVDQPGPRIDPIFYGLMTEEINYSYDGGLYGELIRNRIFQDRPIAPRGARGGAAPPAGAQGAAPAQPPAGSNPAVAKNPNLINWWLVTSDGAAGDMDIDTDYPVNTTALKNSLRLDIKSAGAGRRVGIANDGYWGIPVRPNITYTASFYVRSGRDFQGPLTVSLEGNSGTVYASGQVRAVTGTWPRIAKEAKGEVLSAEPAAMNSVAESVKVAPRPITITNAGPSFTHELPQHSVTVLRLKTR